MAAVNIVPYNIQNQYGSEAEFEQRERVFQEEKRAISLDACDQITCAKAEGKELTAVFHLLLQRFAMKRREIAEEAGTFGAECFGKLSCESMKEGFYRYTDLVGSYQKVNQLAIQRLSEEMSFIRHDKKKFFEKSKMIEEVVQGRQFSSKIEILSGEELHKREWGVEVPGFKMEKIGREEGWSKAPEGLSDPEISKVIFQRMGVFKKKHPDLYAQAKMYFYLKHINEIFPSPQVDFSRQVLISGDVKNLKSDYVLVTNRTEIDGKMYATNQMLTWLYIDFQKDPILRMAESSTITALHQDVFLIDASLKECARLFAEIVETGHGLSEEEIKEKMALLRYIFAHAMPYQRGSAAIGEYLELALYRHLGFSCDIIPIGDYRSVDLVAITALKFSEYLQKYKEMVRIERF